MDPFVVTHSLAFAAGAWCSARIAYRWAVRRNGVDMMRTGWHRASRGSW